MISFVDNFIIISSIWYLKKYTFNLDKSILFDMYFTKPEWTAVR